jgi:hypothetical protein
MTAVVPVGHYLGPIHDEAAGQVRFRVRVGREPEPLDTAVEAAVWLAAHSHPDLPPGTVWTRERVLGLLPGPAGAADAFATLLRDGLLAEVDDGFADRYRVVPLTFGVGWQYDESGFALGTEGRRVSVGAPVLAVWERGADFATLRQACADADPRAPAAALAAMVADLHRLLAVSAVYVDVAPVATLDAATSR